MYNYVGSDPVNRRDVFGLEGVCPQSSLGSTGICEAAGSDRVFISSTRIPDFTFDPLFGLGNGDDRITIVGIQDKPTPPPARKPLPPKCPAGNHGQAVFMPTGYYADGSPRGAIAYPDGTTGGTDTSLGFAAEYSANILKSAIGGGIGGGVKDGLKGTVADGVKGGVGGSIAGTIVGMLFGKPSTPIVRVPLPAGICTF